MGSPAALSVRYLFCVDDSHAVRGPAASRFRDLHPLTTAGAGGGNSIDGWEQFHLIPFESAASHAHFICDWELFGISSVASRFAIAELIQHP